MGQAAAREQARQHQRGIASGSVHDILPSARVRCNGFGLQATVQVTPPRTAAGSAASAPRGRSRRSTCAIPLPSRSARRGRKTGGRTLRAPAGSPGSGGRASGGPRRSRVVDATRAIVVPGANVDHRVELDPVPPFLFGIEVDPPEVPQRGTVGEKRSLVVRMEVATDRHDAARHVDDRLDPVSELLFGPTGRARNAAWVSRSSVRSSRRRLLGSAHRGGAGR